LIRHGDVTTTTTCRDGRRLDLLVPRSVAVPPSPPGNPTPSLYSISSPAPPIASPRSKPVTNLRGGAAVVSIFAPSHACARFRGPHRDTNFHSDSSYPLPQDRDDARGEKGQVGGGEQVPPSPSSNFVPRATLTALPPALHAPNFTPSTTWLRTHACS